VVVLLLCDIAVPGERGDDDAGDAKPDSPIQIADGSLNGGHRETDGGWDVIIKTTPFIEVDDEDCGGPVRAGPNGIVDLIEKLLAIADVGVRMIVGRGAGVFIEELRVNEGDIRQATGLAVR